MPFELKPPESFRKGLRRLVRQQTAKALTHLTGGTGESVHEARKCLKRVRAILLLLRPSIGERRYRAANAGYRVAGQALAPVRDAAVLHQTLDRLADHFQEQGAEEQFHVARRAVSNHPTAGRDLNAAHSAFVKAEAAVRRARRGLKGCWAEVPRTWKAVGDGLAASYRRARSAHRAATADPTVERLHEWRKRAQRLRHQLRLLRSIRPERMEDLTTDLDRAVKLLGEDHDLAIFRQALVGDDRDGPLALVDRRRAELAVEALDLGTRFFRERPRAFEARIRAYWKAWRG